MGRVYSETCIGITSFAELLHRLLDSGYASRVDNKFDDPGHTLPRIKSFEAGDRPHRLDPRTENQKLAWKLVPECRDRRADLAVAGGGLSGVAAAIAASRRGLKVLIVEPTHMVGGQATAAGVSAFDITFYYDKMLNNHGLWSEILARVQDIYDNELGRPVNVGHYRDLSITPNVVVIERALSEMLIEHDVEVLRNTSITGVLQRMGRVEGLETSAGLVHAKHTIDATEDGILLALAGIPHRISNGESNGTSTRGLTSPKRAIQDITYTAVIRKYPSGIPDDLRVTEKPEGYERYAQTFRKIYPGPGIMGTHPRKKGPLGFAGYRAAPDLSSENMHTGADYETVTRTSLNYYNDLATRAEYLTDPDYRVRFEALAKLKTISLIYYLQKEVGLSWSVATDEGFADGPVEPLNPHVPEAYKGVERHMPLIPYIRESRRLIGLSTVTGKSIKRPRNRSHARWRTDSIAVGTYHPDLHGGRTARDLEPDLNEVLADKPTIWVEGPFPIQLGALIPEWMDGFIAAEKNISCSRIAAGAIRLHPTVVAIGEAAGVLASLAFRRGTEVRKVPTGAVQAELALGGALVSQLEVIGVEREDPSFAPITLAVARKRAEWSVVGNSSDPQIQVDLSAALDAGRRTLKFCDPWLIAADTEQPQ